MSFDKGILKFNKGIYFKYNKNLKIVDFAYLKDNLFLEKKDLSLLINEIAQLYYLKVLEIEKYIIFWFVNSVSTESIISLDTEYGKKYFKLEKSNDSEFIYGYIYPQTEGEGLYNLIDPLTGVYQKNSIEEIIKNEIKEAKKEFSLIIVDIDNFKDVNDINGHLFGDKIITEIVNLFKNNLNDKVIGRIGGDEFLIMLYGPNNYTDVWNQLYSIYRAAKYYDGGLSYSPSYAFSSSVYAALASVIPSFTCGVSRYPYDGRTYQEIFNKADKALYRGKGKSKDCFIIYLDEKHKDIDPYILNKNKKSLISSDSTLYNFVSVLYNILNRTKSYEKNLDILVSTVGKYFSVDRVSIYLLNGSCYVKTAVWNNSKLSAAMVENLAYSEENNGIWDMHIIEGLVKFTKTDSLFKYNEKLFKKLALENTKSLLFSYIEFYDKKLGFIRLDSISNTKSFSDNDSKALKIISKLLSLYLYNIEK